MISNYDSLYSNIVPLTAELRFYGKQYLILQHKLLAARNTVRTVVRLPAVIAYQSYEIIIDENTMSIKWKLAIYERVMVMVMS